MKKISNARKIAFGFGLISQVFLTSAFAQMNADHGVGNGGDGCEKRFLEVAADINSWVNSSGPEELIFPAGVALNDYRASMLKYLAPNAVTVACTDQPIFINGAEKTCMNNIDATGAHIKCNFQRFNMTAESEQYPLVHHEYAGLAGLEVNSGATSNYALSLQLTEFLEPKTVLKLGIKKKLSLFSFVKIPSGAFLMGSPVTEKDRNRHETQHPVILTRGFEMQTTHVTQLQWFLVMGFNPSFFNGKRFCKNSHIDINGVSLCPDHPVENVSWDDAQNFIIKLNQNSDGYKYGLPTEAEWEYAARAGSQTAYFFGDDDSTLGDYAWFDKNSGNQPHAVGLKKANAYGLYDVYGNVGQWVQDLYGDYPSHLQVDPTAGFSGYYTRVVRGGGWGHSARGLRSASRDNGAQSDGNGYVGFRLVRTK